MWPCLRTKIALCFEARHVCSSVVLIARSALALAIACLIGLDDFARYVIPELERRGRYERLLAGSTLRDHLGLPRKQSRYALAELA